VKTLLTGFNRFGNGEANPSQLVVENLRVKSAGATDWIAEVLRTEFAEAGRRIVELIREHRPERIICLGFNAAGESIHLERVALNLDDTEQPDNAGARHAGKRIVEDGPLAYWSTLPIEGMREALLRRGIPAAISNHAGTYVCNHVFYVARHEVETLGLDCACGFIHLPSLERMPLKMMMEAVEVCAGFS